MEMAFSSLSPEDTSPGVFCDGQIYIALSHSTLDISETINRVRSRAAGAIVLFAGTTREDKFHHPTPSSTDIAPMSTQMTVNALIYSAYVPLAMRTLLTIARSTLIKHKLQAIAIVHRLGRVSIGEESILVVVSASHRYEAWEGGKEALEECKVRVEIWKQEQFIPVDTSFGGDGGYASEKPNSVTGNAGDSKLEEETWREPYSLSRWKANGIPLPTRNGLNTMEEKHLSRR